MRRWLLAAAAGLAGCATGAPQGRVQVLLASEPDSASEARMVRAVQDAVSTGGVSGAGVDPLSLRGSTAPPPPSAATGLTCVPASGAVLLRCSPATLGSEGQTVTVVVSRIGGGYQVTIDQSWLLPGRESAVCGYQRRIVNAVNAELPGTARPDPHSGCKD